MRLRCLSCFTTHAIIPSFSLPDTSGGTDECEAYLLQRSKGVGRGAAQQAFEEVSVSERYPIQLDKMFEKSVDMAKALFPEAGEPTLHGMKWVASVVADLSRPLYSLNCFCLDHRVNAVCFSRSSILLFPTNSVGGGISHNLGIPGQEIGEVDSS